MVTVTLYDGTGKKKQQVSMDLSKSRTATLILGKIRDAQPGWTLKSLESLDSGRLSPSHMQQLYSPAEMVAAVQSRIAMLGRENGELTILESFLKDAQGGERGKFLESSREREMIGNWMNITGARKSMSSVDIRKSRRATSAADVLVGFGWTSTDGDQKVRRYTNYEHSGHEILLEKSGTQHWVHLKGSREVAKSAGSPVVCAADLLAHLTRLHEPR
jgi:hypothetical protein